VDALLLFGRLKALESAPLTASWDSLAISDRQFCELWVMYGPDVVSTEWLISWLRVLCAECFFTLPQIVEALRRFPLSLKHQVNGDPTAAATAPLVALLPFASHRRLNRESALVAYNK
jgi:hypothetical protein